MTNPPQLFSRETREWFRDILREIGMLVLVSGAVMALMTIAYFILPGRLAGWVMLILYAAWSLFAVFMAWATTSLRTRAAEFFWGLFKRKDAGRS